MCKSVYIFCTENVFGMKEECRRDGAPHRLCIARGHFGELSFDSAQLAFLRDPVSVVEVFDFQSSLCLLLLLCVLKRFYFVRAPRLCHFPRRGDRIPFSKESMSMNLNGIKITWLGHATFLIDTPGGTKI